MCDGLIDYFPLTDITQMVKRMMTNFTYQFSPKSESKASIYCVIKGLK
jgi:hypothetical protein